ncbi:MAG TPA: choice-of-anchor D domain-containing protein [Candidatus Angelobacter sp.]|nr:choice-of-anchor D domain-containing protein [Candidatus Angelobacter sp.]
MRKAFVRPVSVLVCLFFAVGALQSQPAPGVTPPNQPQRALVKLRPSLANDVEADLPMQALTLTGAAAHSAHVRGFMGRHDIQRLAPLYSDLVRAKKSTGQSEAQITARIRQRFARRAARFAAMGAPPEISRTYVMQLTVKSPAEARRALDQLNADPEVEFAEPDHIVATNQLPNDPYLSSSGSWGQSYADLWGILVIGSPAAWDVGTGSGIVVAVVDTGIDYNHPDIAANIWINTKEIASNGIDDDGNGFIDDVRGWDFIGSTYQNPTQSNDPIDRFGHGTHVAGTVAAAGNNGIGVIGVAWNAQVMAVKGLDDSGFGLDSTLSPAVIYAANNGADVISNSWAGQGSSQTIADAISYAYNLGAVVVAAAGNSQEDALNFFPANLPQVITVAASDANSSLAFFSNFGSKIDVAAPGVDILSLRAAGTSLGRPLNSDYTRADGTSMAAPHVSGVAALILSQHPEFSNEQVRQVIRTSASGGGSFTLDTGYGIVGASAALAVPSALAVKIQQPSGGSHIATPVVISGTAQGPGFAQYVVEYGTGEQPSSWTVFQNSSTPVVNGQLGVFDPSSLPDGPYTIQIVATDSSNHVFADRIKIVVDYVSISSPALPDVPVKAGEFKPGVIIPIAGTATGPSFTDYRIDWAEGINPASGWTSTGITLAGGGLSPVSNGTLGNWDTSSVTAADYYTIRVSVDNAGFVSQAMTLVYLEPSLLTANWPKLLNQATFLHSGIVPVQSATGGFRLWLENPLYLGSSLPAQLWSFLADGSAQNIFPLDHGNIFQPAAGNFNNDLALQVLQGEANWLDVFQPDLTSTMLSPPFKANFQQAQIVLADLNNDSRPEVVALGEDHLAHTANLFVWTQNGQQIGANFPVPVPNQNLTLELQPNSPRVLVGDLHGDGNKEIVVQAGTSPSGFSLLTFAADGTPLSWLAPSFDGTPDQMILADLDNNGQLQVIFTQATPTQRIMHVLQPDGSERAGWPLTLANNSLTFLAVGDLDRDGRKEIVVADGIDLYAFEPDGTTFSNAFPIVNPRWLGFGPIALADIDDDGYPEILTVATTVGNAPSPLFPETAAANLAQPAAPTSISEAADVTANSDGTLVSQAHSELNAQIITSSSYNAPVLLALRSDGSLERSWNVLGGDGSQPDGLVKITVGDFGVDGKTNIALTYSIIEGGGVSGTLLEGIATVLTTGAPSNPGANDWPMLYQNPANTTIRAVNPSAPAIVFTAPAANSTLQGVVSVSAAGNDSATINGVQFQLDGQPLGSSQSVSPYTISWDTSTVAVGNHILRAAMNDAAGHVTVSTPLPVTVAVSVTGSVSASALSFAGTAIGSTSPPQAVTLTNTGVMPIAISAIQVTGNFAQTNNCGSSVAVGANCIINVTYSPTAGGSASGSLVIQGNFQTAPPTVFLSGTGLTISASLTPAALNLGAQPQNTTSASQALTYLNTGDLPVSISGLVTSGDFAQTNNCPASLAVSASCTINVTFTPTTTGPRSGSVSVNGNAPASSSLSGTGATPIVSPTALDFGDQTVSTSATLPVTITNSTSSSFFISGWSFGSPYSVVDNCPFTILAGTSCTFSVTFAPQSQGRWNGTFSISGSFPGSPASVSLTGNAIATRGLFNPSSLSFPGQQLNSTSAGQTVFFFNAGNTVINLTGFVVTGDFSQTNNCPASLAANASCSVTVTFTPVADGARSGTLTAQGNFTGGSPSMSLSGTGINPAGSLSPASLTFVGQLVGTSSPAQAITLTSTGDGPLTISQIGMTGDFSETNNCGSSLAAGASCSINVVFKPLGIGGRSGSLTVTSNSTSAMSPISLSGTGLAPVAAVSPSSLNFGSQLVSTPSAGQTLTLSNTGSATLTVSGFSIDNTFEFSQTNNCGSTLAVGASCSINVVFSPSGIGSRSGTLTLNSNSVPALPPVSLSGTGVQPQPQISPVSLNFGSQPVNTNTTAQIVTLSNTGTAPLNVNFINISGDFSQTNNCGTSMAAGASCAINVIFSPTATGTRAGTITVGSNVSIPTVSLAGTGTASIGTFSPASLTYSSQPVGTSSAAQAVTLSNTGNVALSITSLPATGDFSQTNNCGSSLAAGSSCTINVVFSPTAVGSRTGNLFLNSNSLTTPAPVSLTGTGVVPVAGFSSTSLSFAAQQVGTSTPAQAITLSNTGGAPLSITSLAATGDFSQTNNCGATLAAGANCTVNVVFTPTAMGSRGGSIVLNSNSSPAPAAPALSGSGIAPVASISPTSLAFASQLVGTSSATQTVIMTNTGTASLAISGFSVTGDYSQTSNCGSSLAVNASCQINVSFVPTARGARSGSLVLSSNSFIAAPAVALSGTGVAPVAGMSPSSLNFAAQIVNTASAAQAVTLSNTGDAALSISGISVSGDFSQTNNCPATLATGAGCTIHVTFTPRSSGSRSGTLTVTDNAAGGQQTAALSGVGLDYSLSVTPSSTTISAGQSASYTVTAAALGPNWSTAISLTCSGLPAASTCSLTPNNVTPGSGSASSTLSIVTTARRGTKGTPAGTYTITVKGTSAGVQHSATVSLTVN